jgi:hypothetical protein
MRPAPGVLADDVGGKAVLIDPSGRHVIELNAVGSLVWRALDGEREVEDLVEVVLEAVTDDVAPETVDRDVRAFLAELDRLALLDG